MLIIKGLGTFKVAKDDTEKDVVFVPDKDLAEAVNAPFSQFEPVELCDEVTSEMLNKIDATMEQPANDEMVATETASPDENVGMRLVSSDNGPEEAAKPASQDENVGMKSVSSEKATEDVVTKHALTEPEPQEEYVPRNTKSRNPHTWLIAAAAAVVLIAVWYFLTHRNKERSDKAATEITQVAKNDTTTNDTKPHPVVTDTIGNGNVLFTMAKKHYGDQAFWVYIARENQVQYPDYRKIKSGTVLVIPPAEKYGINSDSKQSLKQAGIEAMKLYKEVKAADESKAPKNEVVKIDEKTKPQNATPSKKHSSRHSYHKKHQKRRYHR